MTRSRFAPTALALLALLAAAPGLAQGEADAPAATRDDPVVLRLGTETWTRSEIDDRFELSLRSIAAGRGVELTPEIRAQLEALRPQFLEERAREVVLVAEARERGLSVADEAIDEQVERIRSGFEDEAAFEALLESSGIGSVERLRGLVRENAMMGALYEDVRQDREFGEDELRTAYLSRRDVFRTSERVCARHILLEDAEAAEDVLAELEGGADFARLAEERSVGPTAPQGGDLGCFERGRMVPAFEEAVFSGEVDEPFGPVETEFGQHVILVTERQDARIVPFEEVRDDVRAALTEAAAQAHVETLVRTSGVVTYPERLGPADAPPAVSDEGETPTPPVPDPVEPGAPATD